MRLGSTTTLMLMVAVFAATTVGNALQTTAPTVLVVSVPEGGTVGTVSKNFSCGAGETCEIQIDDEFHEVFIPQHKVGYRFSSWKQSSEHFCGGHIVQVHHHNRHGRFGYLIWNRYYDRDVASTGYRLEFASWTIATWGCEWLILRYCSRSTQTLMVTVILDLFRAAGELDFNRAPAP